MALSVIITKKSVSKMQDKLYSVTVNMILKDGTTDVLNQDFHVKYRTGDNIANKKAVLQAEMQGVIDNYKAEQLIFSAIAFTTMCTQIQNGLVLQNISIFKFVKIKNIQRQNENKVVWQQYITK